MIWCKVGLIVLAPLASFLLCAGVADYVRIKNRSQAENAMVVQSGIGAVLLGVAMFCLVRLLGV